MKDFINKFLDVPKFIRNIWICLWICLLILVIMKLCFNIWYPIVVRNESLLELGNTIDSISWLRYIILGLFYVFSTNFIYLSARIRFRYSSKLEMILINIFLICTFAVKCFNIYLGYCLEVIYSIIIPIIINIKTHNEYSKPKLILYTILLQALLYLWQLNILFVRGLPENLNSINIIIQIILQLDYYIFLSIIWLGVGRMGLISIWIFSKDVTKLKSKKEKELAKANPDETIIKKLDAKIAKLEKAE